MAAGRLLRTLLALAALGAPLAATAVLPLLVMLGHKIVKDMILHEVQGQLIGQLSGMGCKGARVAGLIAAAGSVTHGPGHAPPGLPRAPGPAALGGPPAGGPGQGGGLLGKLSGRPPGMGMAAPGGVAMGETGHMGLPTMDVPPGGQPSMADAMAAMQRQHPGMAAAASPSPEQMARVQEAMGELQEAMDHPLSRLGTLEVFDELAGMGVLTDSMHLEIRECILLAAPGSDRALGQTGAMMKSVVLPRLRSTREQLANLSPEEQDELAEGLENAVHEATPAERRSLQEGLGLGYFPAPVVEKVRGRLGWR